MSTGLISKRVRDRGAAEGGGNDPSSFAARLKGMGDGVQQQQQQRQHQARPTHPAVAALGGRPSLMPDTPCKRSVFIPPTAWRPTSGLHIESPRQDGIETTNYSSSASSSPSPSFASRTMSPAADLGRHKATVIVSGGSLSPSSGSGSDNSPTAPSKSGRPSLLRRRPLFRKKRSGHLSVNVNKPSQTPAGESHYCEPATPTRINGDHLSDRKYLVLIALK
jgi:hypothetical protein